jgi:hypothetical protein
MQYPLCTLCAPQIFLGTSFSKLSNFESFYKLWRYNSTFFVGQCGAMLLLTHCTRTGFCVCILCFPLQLERLRLNIFRPVNNIVYIQGDSYHCWPESSSAFQGDRFTSNYEAYTNFAGESVPFGQWCSQWSSDHTECRKRCPSICTHYSHCQKYDLKQF